MVTQDERERIKGSLITPTGEFTYEYVFYHNNTYNIDTYTFLIWDEADIDEKEKADFSLLIMPDGLHLKVIDMFTNGYAGNKIAIGMVLKSKELFGKEIISSSNKNTSKSFRSEANWEEAMLRVWEPLVKQGKAIYDDLNDYYIVS